MKNPFWTLAVVSIVVWLGACGGGSDTVAVESGNTSGTIGMTLSGVAMDGYLSNALVFLDSNDNGRFDEGEPFGSTDSMGKYAVSVPPGQSLNHMMGVVASAGKTIDLDSPGIPLTQGFSMLAPAGKTTVISPLTTLVVAKMSAGLTLEQAVAEIKGELGLPSEADLFADYVQGGNQSADIHKFAAATAEALKSVAATAMSNASLKEVLAAVATQFSTQVLAYTGSIRAATDPAAAAAITAYASNFKPTAMTATACAALQSASIPAGEFSLETSGATITSATFVQTGDSGNINGNFCKVMGKINPVTDTGNAAFGELTANPSIVFEVNLPAAWNGKFAHMGGGGFDGTLGDGSTGVPGPSGLAPLNFAPTSAQTPLAQGYMTFGSDSGHQSSGITKGDFAANDVALANYGRLQLKKTQDAALFLMRTAYQVQRQLKGYFFGSSTGGRDGLAVIQNWPENYDAIVIHRPAHNYTGLRLANIQLGRSLWLDSSGAASAAGWINSYKTTVLMNAVMSACDSLDGLQDGIISNLDGCKAKSEETLASIRCPGGADTGNTCLSDAQMATVKTMASPLKLGYSLANGVNTYGGYNIMAGMVFGGPEVTYCADTANNVPAYGSPYASRDFGPSSTGPKLSSTGNFSSLFSNWCKTVGGGAAGTSPNAYHTGSDWMKFFIARLTENFDPRRLDPASGYYAGTPSAKVSGTTFAATAAASYMQRIIDVSNQTDATATDLDAFIKKGGKIIWTHGSADEVVSTDSSVDYYKQLVDKYGQARLDSFVRFYIVNGNGHGDTGPFIPVFDSLSVLTDWAEKNIDPADRIVMGNKQIKSPLDSSQGGTVQRPMCRYPTWPKYSGGDPDLASSFTCVAQ